MDPAVLDRLPLPPFTDDSMDLVMNHAKLLAEMIPPLSGPAGSMRSDAVFKKAQSRTVDMNDNAFKNAGRWPTDRPWKSRDQREEMRWLHGDYKDAPYLLTRHLYVDITNIANGGGQP